MIRNNKRSIWNQINSFSSGSNSFNFSTGLRGWLLLCNHSKEIILIIPITLKVGITLSVLRYALSYNVLCLLPRSAATPLHPGGRGPGLQNSHNLRLKLMLLLNLKILCLRLKSLTAFSSLEDVIMKLKNTKVFSRLGPIALLEEATPTETPADCSDANVVQHLTQWGPLIFVIVYSNICNISLCYY